MRRDDVVGTLVRVCSHPRMETMRLGNPSGPQHSAVCLSCGANLTAPSYKGADRLSGADRPITTADPRHVM